MCETRLQVRESRVSYSKKEQDAKVPVDAIQEEEVVEPVKKPRSRAPPKKDADSKDKKDWTKVTKKVESKK